MESDKDVLGKADALLRRHTPGSAVGSETGSVPVLTDLVDDTGAADVTDDLAREVLQRVMTQVEGRIAAELERRVALHLVPQVHAAVESALGDLRQEIASAIGEAVAEALRNRPVR